MNYQSFNQQQISAYHQQLVNNPTIDQYPPRNIPIQHNQCIPTSTSNIHFIPSHQPAFPPNMNHQYEPSHAGLRTENVIAPQYEVSTNPTGASTPVVAHNKRTLNDTSTTSESNKQAHPPPRHKALAMHSSNTPYKRQRGGNFQENMDRTTINHQQKFPEIGTHSSSDTNDNRHLNEPSTAAYRYATSRYPFAPFATVFNQEVKEKLVINDLINHARNVLNFDLKIIAHRRGHAENNEHRLLIFVENTESFAFLYDQANWPMLLANVQFTIKSPSIPPQLALVLPYVSLQTDWEDFVDEIKNNYPKIISVIRLKNKAQQPVRAVKLELNSSAARTEILEKGELTVLHMKYKVVEYMAQLNVLICSNCQGIGHFRNSCPEKNQSTCKTCGDKYSDAKDHQCSGILKCKHCGGPHASNDTKCQIVKDYRAAITRNLMNKAMQPPSSRGAPTNIINRGSYATIVQSTTTNTNDELMSKIDTILVTVEQEAKATQVALRELKEEMQKEHEITKQQVNALEKKVLCIEQQFEGFAQRINLMMRNVCTAFLDPEGVKSPHWKSYWQEQIKLMKEAQLKLAT